MILRKITLENFRQIYGKHEISFALPGSRNVTVILGQNGAGKTTLLNSFLWCLYNRLDMENPDEIVCHKAVQDVAIGDKVAAEVTSAHALNNATLHYGLQLADKGLKALVDDQHLRNGLNVHKGRITNRAVAEALGYEMAEPKAVLAA